MVALRDFPGVVLAQGGRHTTQEWIRLQIFGRGSTNPDPSTPTLESNGNEIPEINQPRKRHGAHSSKLLYSFLSAIKYLVRKWDARFPGWRGGVAGFSILVALVLLINVSALIWAISHLDERPYATMTMQSCKNVTGLSFWVQLGINVFSTALLAGSNYCMQCLTSPTREEVDAKHERSSWLNIGVLSWRNVRSCRKRRIGLLLALLLSSVPLYFVYNSVVLIGGAVQAYDVAVVTPEFFANGTWSLNGEIADKDDIRYEDRLRKLQDQATNGQDRNQSHWKNLSAAECKDHYKKYQSDLGSVLLVTEAERDPDWKPSDAWLNERGRRGNGTVQWYEFMWQGQSMDFTLSWYLQPAKAWRVYEEQDSPILYCLALKVPYRCRLQIHVWFLLTVVLLNTVKLACMLCCFWEQKGAPLMVVGDAIASFLKTPCVRSEGMCLLSEEELVRELKKTKDSKDDDSDDDDDGEQEEECAKEFRAISVRYYHSVSFLRWCVYLTSCMLAILAAFYWYNEMVVKYRGDHVFPANLRTFWKMGFGNLYEMSSGWVPPPWCSLYSNRESKIDCFYSRNETLHMLIGSLPQIVVSLIYVVLNHQLTLMVQLRDWTRLALHHQSLRVSEPEPDSDQVSTYWLSLPYTYSSALLVSSVLLGWFASQAIFFYRTAWYDNDGTIFKKEWSRRYLVPWQSYGVGYSPLGVICAIAFGILVFAASLALGFRRCVRGLPLGPSNSFVIAAACHPPEGDRHAARKLVRWGAVDSETARERRTGHCTITSRQVEAPIEGYRYA